MRVVREIFRDTIAIARTYFGGRQDVMEVLKACFYDGSQVLALTRLRQAARRRHVPLVDGALRRLQTSLYGAEISAAARLGEGVLFMHTFGIVVGGDATVGDRVLFLGSNTLGTVRNDGYPRIGNDVVLGAGARILGPVCIGDGASIGANAVVVRDVPAGATAIGVPAVIHPARASDASRAVSATNGEAHESGESKANLPPECESSDWRAGR